MPYKLKLKSVKEIERLWKKYKAHCDKHTANITHFDKKRGYFVSKKLVKPITYTIQGFCHFAKIPRSTFYLHYAKNANYLDTIARARMECELDAREKFETGAIPTRLANLWLGHNYGYFDRAKKGDTNSGGDSPVDKWIDEVMDKEAPHS